MLFWYAIVLTDGLDAGHNDLREGGVHLLGLKEHPRLTPVGDVISKSYAPVRSWSEQQVEVSRRSSVRS